MLYLYLLGPCIIRTGAGVIGPRAKKLFSLAAYLIVERGKPIARRKLIQLFWPDRNEHAARHPLREALRKLRRQGIPIIGDSQSEHVSVPRHLAMLDTDQLIDADPESLLTRDFTVFPAYEPRISPAHSYWIDETRAHVRLGIAQDLGCVVAREKGSADWAVITKLASRVLELDPVHTGARQAMEHAHHLQQSMTSSGKPPDQIFAARLRETPIGDAIPSLDAYTAEQDTILEGRDEALDLFANALTYAARGTGSAFVLTGPPGIGKSRLTREIARRASDHTAVVARGGCVPGDTLQPFALWRELVPQLRQLPGAGGCHPTTNTELDDLLYTEPSNSPFVTNDLSNVIDTDAVCNAVLDLIEAITYEQPLVLVVEDLQWIDEPSRHILHTVAEAAKHQALLCVGTQQDTAHPIIFAKHTLTPLDTTALERHLERYRRGVSRQLPNTIREWCIEHADGNPLFVEEVVNAWITTPHEPLPTTHAISLPNLIDLRIRHIDDPSRRILQSCALLGRHATVSYLARMAQTLEWRVTAIANELRTTGLLATTGRTTTIGEQRFYCRHDLIAERVLAVLSDEERRSLQHTATTMINLAGLPGLAASYR